MDLLSLDDIKLITKHYGEFEVLKYDVKPLSDKLVGYLGEHLKLVVNVESGGKSTELRLFIKCMPRFDEWKSNYIRELSFFKKEYVMLSELFTCFGGDEGCNKWRAKPLFVKEEIFVFEDLTTLGYVMPKNTETFTFAQCKAAFETVARFHAQSYIYEENRSKQIGRCYRIYEDYGEFLKEPTKGRNWRQAGRDAIIHLLKKYSPYNTRKDFAERLEKIVPKLFDTAMVHMEPSATFRNVVIHRDIWSNNIFFKKLESGHVRGIIVDFQTVLYCPPTHDLASVLYFNTTRSFREKHLSYLLEHYHDVLSKELEANSIASIFDKYELVRQYKKSILFGITQASIIVPIIALNEEDRENIFCNPETSLEVNEVSRSQELAAVTGLDDRYYERVMELLHEIVDIFIYPDEACT